MTKSFEGKIALVTGGGSGIGRAIARRFANEGAEVVVSDMMAEGGKETVSLITAAGGRATFLKVDVTKAADVNGMLGEVERVCGRLDFAINSAGIDGIRARTAEYPEETWAEVINVNLTGVFLCMKYEIPLMLRHGGGVIVNLSSIAGLAGFANYSAYAASKHGVVGLTKTTALEYAKQGIRVNAICPAYTRTPMLDRVMAAKPGLEAKLEGRLPIGRLGTPEEIAAAAVYLCSEHASFVTGHAFVMDGGILAE